MYLSMEIPSLIFPYKFLHYPWATSGVSSLIFAVKMLRALENALYICYFRYSQSLANCDWTRTREQVEKPNPIKGNRWLSKMLWMSYQQHLTDPV